MKIISPEGREVEASEKAFEMFYAPAGFKVKPTKKAKGKAAKAAEEEGEGDGAAE